MSWTDNQPVFLNFSIEIDNKVMHYYPNVAVEKNNNQNFLSHFFAFHWRIIFYIIANVAAVVKSQPSEFKGVLNN